MPNARRALVNNLLSVAVVFGGGVVYLALPGSKLEWEHERLRRFEERIAAQRTAWLGRRARHYSDPEMNAPINEDGVLLLHPTEIYRLFLPDHEIPRDGITAAELQKLLGNKEELFSVEWRTLTGESKYCVLLGLPRTGLSYDKRVIRFSLEDYGEWKSRGLNGFEGDKRVVLTNIVGNARGIPAATGEPAGVGSYAYEVKFGKLLSDQDLAGAFPRRPF